VDPGPFDAFSASTHSLLEGADSESAQIAEVQRTFFIFAAAAGKLEANSFEPTVNVSGRQQNVDLVRQFNERVAILEAIAHYADALSAFAKKDYQSGVDSAATKLDGSIVTLSTTTGGAGSEATAAAGYLATAVDALGHAIIEYERVRALRRAVALAQPGLSTLARLLVAGNDLIERQIGTYRDDILQDANATINANPSGFSRVEISALVAEPVSDANVSIVRLGELNKSVTLLPLTNQELADSLCSSAPSLTNLKELVSEAQRVAKFHAGLK
jgi:hypothetical protein